MFCKNCGKEIDDNAFVCPHCGVRVDSEKKLQAEGSAVGWGILSYLIPLVGLILFLTWKDTKPHTAKVSGICALVSFAINIIITIIYGAMVGSILGGYYGL